MSTIRSSNRSGCSFWSSSRWPGDSIWKHPSVSEARISSNVAASSSGNPLEVDLLPGGAGDLVDRVAHRREHPHAQDVELEIAEQLDVVLVGLDHAVPVGAALQRHPAYEVVAREHDPAGVQRDVPREPVEPLGHPEQQIELSHRQLEALQLGQLGEALPQVPGRDVREGLGHDANLGLGQAERLADLAHRRARPVGVDHRHARGALVPVAREDHVVDVLAAGGLDVDIDVGRLAAHRVHEPLEREVVVQRIDVGDAGEVAHERAGGASPASREDAHRLDVGHDVGHRQEVGRVAHPADHRELQVQPLAQRARPRGARARARRASIARRAARRRFDPPASGSRESAPAAARDRTCTARRSRACGRTGRDARRTTTRIAAGGFSHPSALARVTFVEAIGTMRRMHSSASATNASAGSR